MLDWKLAWVPMTGVVLAAAWTGCLVDIPDVVSGGGGSGGQTGGDDAGGGGSLEVGAFAGLLCAGDAFTCAAVNGNVACWGDNTAGQLGTNDGGFRASPVGVALPPELDDDPVTAVACGAAHACARLVSGRVVCWGSSSSLQAGGCEVSSIGAPRIVTTCPDEEAIVVSSIAAGADSTCAVDGDGGGLCWGAAPGDASLAPRAPSPIEIGEATAIAVAKDHACASTPDGVACWGRNDRAQLGGTDTAATSNLVTGSQSAGLAVALGYTCAVDAGGRLRCWGDAEPLAPSGDPAPAPFDVEGVLVSAIATSDAHACAITGDARGACWGSDADGRLGDGASDGTGAGMRAVASSERLVAITVGHAHSCALSVDAAKEELRAVYCWGDNGRGQLGFEGASTDAPSSPVSEQQ